MVGLSAIAQAGAYLGRRLMRVGMKAEQPIRDNHRFLTFAFAGINLLLEGLIFRKVGMK